MLHILDLTFQFLNTLDHARILQELLYTFSFANSLDLIQLSTLKLFESSVLLSLSALDQKGIGIFL